MSISICFVLCMGLDRLKVMVRYIQLDNQLPLAAMPVLLAPETGDENEESVVKATINVYNDNSNVIAVYPYIGIRVRMSFNRPRRCKDPLLSLWLLSTKTVYCQVHI